MKGNEAVAEAAVRAGVAAYFGYPITPQTELLEYMSHRMPELGRAFVQAESELAAINMVYGAACTGSACDEFFFQPRREPDDGRYFLYCRHRTARGAGGCDARRTRAWQHCPRPGGLQPDGSRRRTRGLQMPSCLRRPACRNRLT